MFNLARQAFNPFQSSIGPSFQPGAVGSGSRCPLCGNAVGIGGTIQPQPSGFNYPTIGASFGQQFGVPTPYAVAQSTGLGQINPLAAQFAGGALPGINPMVSQSGANWPALAHLAQQGLGTRTGLFGDPRHAFGGGQQPGYADPTQIPGLNPGASGDPISSLLSQQWNQQTQQQLPIRPLIGGQQGSGFQPSVPGFGLPTTQFADPYRMFIEAQLIAQLANNPLYQLQRAYGGVPEIPGVAFGVGQQFSPFFGNVPFYG